MSQEQDLSNPFDKERRKASLSRKIREYTEDIQRQFKTKEGKIDPLPFKRLLKQAVIFQNRYRQLKESL